MMTNLLNGAHVANKLFSTIARLRLLLVMFVALTVSANAWGAEYTITFKSASSDSNSDLGTSPTVSNVVSSGTSYVASFSGCSKIYVGKSGIKLGSGSATGTMNFTLATNYQSNIKSIKVVSAKYGSDTGTLTLYSGSTSLKSGISPGTDYTHTFSSPTKVTSLKLTTSSKRAYITKIVITTEEIATCTTNPTVSAGSHSNVTTTTATVSCSGGITSLGSAGCSITSYGFVYGTSSNPTISNTKVQVGTTYTTTSTAFTKGLTGLTANTTYYVRPYATNGNGTAYGTQTSFKTLELPKYTVTLNAGPGTCAASVTEASAGAGVTLPTPTLNGCGEWTFAGWKTTSAVTTETTTKPTLIAAGAYSPTSDITLYAVYQRTEKTEGGGSVTSQTDEVTISDFGTGTSTRTYPATYADWTWAKNSGSNIATYDEIRLYASHSMKISPKSGYTIESIVATCTNSSYASALAGSSLSGADKSVSGSEVTITPTSGDIVITQAAQSRVSKFTVTYSTTAGGTITTTYYHSIPECGITQPSVTLHPNGGDGEEITETTEGTTYTVPTCSFSRTGYNFVKWNTKADGTGTDYNPNATINLDGTAVNLFAIWTPITYTITYELNGGTNHASNPENYTIETETITLQNPSKQGCDFVGWYKESTFATQVTQIAKGSTGDITLYAKWEVAVITYTITCSVNDETITSKTYEQGATIEFPAVTPCDGMDFVGWTEIENYANETTAPSDLLTTATAEKTTTYYAVFAKLVEDSSAPYQLVEADRADWSGKYLIAYNDQTFADGRIGGKIAEGSIGKTGHNIDLSSYIDGNNIPSENGDPYHVNLVSCEGGEYLLQTQDGKYNYYSSNETGLNANTIKATAEPYKLNVIFNNSNDIQLALSGDAAGSVFHHNPSDQIFQFYKNASMSPVYLYRQNEVYRDYSTRCKYTVTFDANGHGEAPESQVVYKNELATEPDEDPQGEGYNFQGWYDNQQCTGNAYNFATPITDNITLYAKWTPAVYTITYKDQGNVDFSGSHESGYPTKHTYGTATTLKGATKTGYTFGGWYDNSSCTSTALTQLGATDYTSGITLYAKWTVNSYTVTWNPNGGNWGGSTDSKKDTYNYGATITKPVDPTRDGYRFDGWGDVAGTMPANNLEYTAQWTPVYTITWLANGQEFHKQENAVEGTALDLPDSEPDAATYACDDKVFVGWTSTQIDGSIDAEPADLFTTKNINVEAASTTFYAVFATAEGDGGSAGETTTVAIGDQVVIIQIDDEKTELTGFRSDKLITENNNYGTHAAYSTTPSATLVWTVEEGASDGTFAFKNGNYYLNLGGNDNYLSCCTTKNTSSSWTVTESSDRAVVTNVMYNSRKIMWNQSSPRFASYAKNHGLNSNQYYYHIKFYKLNGGTTYSNYTTTCVKLPDPVLTFETEPANPIVFTDAVCGGNSSKQSVTVVGENLRDVVNVSVTGPYKIARTASTALKDFNTSLTLDKTAAGAIHSNYQTVYIISTPPAQSTEATTGTLTFTTTKGDTLTVNLSTPTVTCTQYTLTLVDRGVSTEQPTKYYAGETINEAPADPEGVCTDPIHYVFDGWAERTVTNGSTGYTPVSFPYTVTGNTKFYAVYRYLEGGGNGDYNLVTSALDDWSGDYLIAYSDQIFANGTISGESGIGAKNNKVDLSSNISNNTIPATVGDQYNVTLEAVTGGYVLKTQDGKYNYHTNNTGNGISASTIGYADDYPITVKFVSEEEINLCLGGSAIGSVFRYNAQGFFRFYKNGGQNPVYLYKKADGTTYYTTSPVCGPHLAITEGKDIYVTGGNAGGTRDLVIAQTKVSYKATRLEKDKSTGNLPSIKALPSNIVFDNTKTKAVAVTFDEDSVRTLQSDGTYTITGNITIAYQPAAANVTDDIQVTLNANYNPSADVSQASFTVHARSLPSEFVIVAKSGDKWYALNGDMNNGSSANPANGQVTLDDDANPTKATYAPCNTIYTFDGVPNTGDRTRVRFQGTDGAWLWAASGTNVGIQNKSLKETPESNNKAYNWKLETDDNITYKFHNDNNSRLLGLNGEKFGMYASGVQDIRILPYVEKCLYNYAPTNLKVTVLKGTYVTLTWDAVAGATKYQYRTDTTNWTDCGTEPTATINDLTVATGYTYYIRAYHEDTGVSQECIDYAEITFTTADCDDVPTDITYTADLNSITVSWTAAAQTATIKLYLDENGEHAIFTQSGTTSPWKISTLSKNTTYYLQIFSDGTCASPIVPVKTEDVEVDIVEWQPQGIIVDINTDETVGVTLENEVSFGSGLGTEATELFFSKYYEASYNVKLVAIYNGTKNIIDLTDYTIQYGKTSWESNYITLKDFGATKGQIQPGEEIILYSYTENNADDKKILDCVHEDFPDGNWVEVTSSNNDGKGTLSFGGDKTIILCKTEYDDEADEYYDNIIDVIGALIEDPNEGILPTNENTEKPSWGDKEGWVCEEGLSIADDSQIGISTNRCLLVRNNTVTSGLNAVEKNIEGDFVTLCSEWKGAQVPDSDIDNGVAASCENFAYVGTFDYSDYYTKYVPMGDEQVFDANARNADGTVTIPITDLYKHACSNIRVKLSNEDGEVLSDREYKVPIMITTTQGTDGEAFIALQQNLATKKVDGEGNVINTYPLSLDEVREICKTCDVVVRDNATLTKVTDGTENDHPQVHDVIVYEGASIVIPDGDDHNYTINSLSLRRKGDDVASAQVQGTGKLVLPADVPVTLNMRIDANNWHWFTLPYDCDIADVTWSDGTEAKYNTDWFLMYYDGESRAASTNPHDNHWKVYNEKTIEAGKGYIIGITGDLAHPNYTFELRFPMEQDVLTAEQTNKTVALNAWGVQSDNTPNNKGWNLVGNPYLNYYKTADEYSYEGLPLLQYTGIDPETGDRLYDDNGNIPFLVTPIDGGWYEYQQELASEVNMMPFTAYFVQVGDPETHTNGQDLKASFEASNRGKKSIVRRAPREVEEIEEPIIVRVELTNSKGESDKTSLVIDDRFTNEYEMNGDFFKWFGDYYNYYTKPVLYTIGADQGKRAFNALNEELAKQPIPMGMYAAQAGNYTFSLNQQFDLSRVEEVWLYDATENVYTNLMQQDYTFSTTKVNGEGRFSLSVKMMPELSTEIENIKQGNIWATTRNNEIVVNGLSKGMQLWIYDATGKLLHSDRTTNYQHSYGIPQTGAYFIRVHNNNEAQTIAVVVE